MAVDMQEVVKGVSEATGMVKEVAQGGSLGGLGNKALETMVVQIMAAAVPAMVNKALNACGPRRAPPKSGTPEISPIQPVHHRMDSENSVDSQDEEHEGTLNFPSEDFNNFSMDTDRKIERGDRFLSNLQKENQSRRIQMTKLKKQMSMLETQHKSSLESLKQEIADNKSKEKENHDETKDKEPEIPEPLRATEDRQKWVAKHIDCDKLTCKHKNTIVDHMKSFMHKKNNIDTSKIWVQLTKGSLIIEAEADDDNGNYTWPGDQEMLNMVDNVIRDAAAPTPPPGMPTMAERVRDAIDPWQTDRSDPWRNGNVEDHENYYKNCDKEDHKERGFRLVSEKDINLTKLHGEQDPTNKIPYMKWAKRIKEFIESNGKRGLTW